MNQVQHLVQFSLKKRFMNTTYYCILGCVFITMLAIFFVDYIMMYFEIYPKPIPVVLQMDDDSFAQSFEELLNPLYYQLTDAYHHEQVLANGGMIIVKQQEAIFVHTNEALDMTKRMLLEQSLEFVYQSQQEQQAKLTISYAKLEDTQEDNTMAFFLITTIYFIILGNGAMIANEVVHEKTTRLMELILVSVGSAEHLLSKIIIGISSAFIQCVMMFLCGLVAFVMRFGFDRCTQLIKLAQYYGFLVGIEKIEDFSFFQNLNIEMILKFVLCLIFLFLGVLFVQIVLVILSSFISSIEQTSNIQSPFYLAMMVIYYLAIFYNQPQYMQSDIGIILSYMPLTSMLFMPNQILFYQIPIHHIALSLLFNGFMIVAVVFGGSRMYKKGLLDYSSNSLFSFFKGLFVKRI